MKKRNFFIFLCLLSALALGVFLQFVPNMAVAAEATFLPPDPDPVPFYEGMGKFVRGGRNVEAYKYIHQSFSMRFQL